MTARSTAFFYNMTNGTEDFVARFFYLLAQRTRYHADAIRETVTVAFNVRNQLLESFIHVHGFLRGGEELSKA